MAFRIQSLLTMRTWAVIAIVVILLLSSACNDSGKPQVERETPSAVSKAKPLSSDSESRYASEEQEEVRLMFRPFPEAAQPGELPRSHAGYTLLDPDFPGGKEYTKGKVLHLEDKINGLRLRLFFRKGEIIRIMTFWPMASKDEQEIETLFDQIRTSFGNPNRDLPGEWIYADTRTVIVFSLGGGYLITDLADADRVEFPPHVAELIQNENQ